MLSFKNLIFAAGFVFFAFLFIFAFMPLNASAAFYCPSGYSYNSKLQLCIGNGKLKGYNTIPSKKINITKTEHHIYICPNKYVYSKKIQLCKGQGSLKGYNVQPAVQTVKTENPANIKN